MQRNINFQSNPFTMNPVLPVNNNENRKKKTLFKIFKNIKSFIKNKSILCLKILLSIVCFYCFVKQSLDITERFVRFETNVKTTLKLHKHEYEFPSITLCLEKFFSLKN